MNTSPGLQKLAAAAAHCRAYGLDEEATACDEAAQIIAQYLPPPDLIDVIGASIASPVRFVTTSSQTFGAIVFAWAAVGR